MFETRLIPISVMALLLGGWLTGCAVDLEPLPQPVYVTAPENLRQRYDHITGQQVLNLVPQAEMERRAQHNLDEELALYRRFGLRQVTDPADPRLARLTEIAGKVHRKSHLADREMSFILIENDTFQAYTFGGKAVVFYSGLVDMLDDDTLAIVVGHELAHVAAGHIAEETSRTIVNTNHPETLPPLAGFYGLNAEIEADRVGLVYAFLAGYDPRAGAVFWAEQAKHGSSQTFNLFLDNHPPYQDRARYLERDAAILMQHATGEDIVNHDRYLRCNPLYCFDDTAAD